MEQRDYILFDLDGTLTDPGEGIVESLQHSLKHFDIEGEPETLKKFIGPPLIDSFMGFYNFDEKKAKEAIKYYREYFHDHGVLKNYIYPGIAELLQNLAVNGKQLAIATTKPTIYAKQVLEHFKIDHHFPEELVVGSYLDGRRTNKGELITTALQLLQADPSKAVMIGDRKFDMLGAKTNGIPAIGVTYGYGDREELEQAGATKIVDSVDELQKLLLA